MFQWPDDNLISTRRPVRPDLANFHNFGKNLKTFCNKCKVYHAFFFDYFRFFKDKIMWTSTASELGSSESVEVEH